MNSKVQSVQDELNILRTYMDKEFPVRAVQIANLLRAIRSLSEEQQVWERGQCSLPLSSEGRGGGTGLELAGLTAVFSPLQYELEDIEDLSKRFLETLAEKEQQEEERILQAVAEVRGWGWIFEVRSLGLGKSLGKPQ